MFPFHLFSVYVIFSSGGPPAHVLCSIPPSSPPSPSSPFLNALDSKVDPFTFGLPGVSECRLLVELLCADCVCVFGAAGVSWDLPSLPPHLLCCPTGCPALPLSIVRLTLGLPPALFPSLQVLLQLSSELFDPSSHICSLFRKGLPCSLPDPHSTSLPAGGEPLPSCFPWDLASCSRLSLGFWGSRSWIFPSFLGLLWTPSGWWDSGHSVEIHLHVHFLCLSLTCFPLPLPRKCFLFHQGWLDFISVSKFLSTYCNVFVGFLPVFIFTVNASPSPLFLRIISLALNLLSVC